MYLFASAEANIAGKAETRTVKNIEISKLSQGMRCFVAVSWL